MCGFRQVFFRCVVTRQDQSPFWWFGFGYNTSLVICGVSLSGVLVTIMRVSDVGSRNAAGDVDGEEDAYCFDKIMIKSKILKRDE